MSLPELLISTVVTLVVMLMLWTSFLTTLQCVSVYVRPPYEEQAYLMDTISLVKNIEKFLRIADEITVDPDGTIRGRIKVLDNYTDFSIHIVESGDGVTLVVNGVSHFYDNITHVSVDASHLNRGNVVITSEYVYSVRGTERRISRQFMVPLMNMVD